jgi:hypothetical protein
MPVRTTPPVTETAAEEPPPLSLYTEVKTSSRPVVLRLETRKKRRYSKPLKRLQRSLDSVDRARERFYGALAAGATKYRERARASADRKRDGMLKDAWQNSARAFETVLRKSAKVPRDLARAASTDPNASVRTLRNQLRVLHWLSRAR